jgi:hypothetical protein
MRSPSEIRRALIEAGVEEAVIERALAALHGEVWIRATRSDTFARGESRIGGVPDLPRDLAWPRHRWPRAETASWPDYARTELAEAIASGVVIDDGDAVALALPFVAQLDLAVLQHAALPPRGQLIFFADQGTTLGEIADYPYCASACVFTEHEVERVTPPPASETLPGFALAFARGSSLPDLDLIGEAWQRYEAARKRVDQSAPRHACFVRSEYGSIAPVPPDGWVGLLRVDSDDVLNWGDAAWITFAIPEDALAARRFDEVRAFRWIG